MHQVKVFKCLRSHRKFNINLKSISLFFITFIMCLLSLSTLQMCRNVYFLFSHLKEKIGYPYKSNFAVTGFVYKIIIVMMIDFLFFIIII